MISTLLFTHCSSPSNDGSDENDSDEKGPIEIKVDPKSKPGSIINYTTPIRPDDTVWMMGEILTDTLIFQDFDSDYDYWYAIFITTNGDTTYLIYDEIIDVDLAGSTFEIKWEIASFYEAGEENEPYFAEGLLSYTIIKMRDNFEKFINDFTKVYVAQQSGIIDEYIHEGIGIMTTFNPGVYCTLEDRGLPRFIDSFKGKYIVSDQFPDGSVCDSFPGKEDGFYYMAVKHEDLPEYANMIPDGDVQYKRPELPENRTIEDYRKAILISEAEIFGSFYFIQVKGNWYLWIEDLCDCSA